MMNLLVKIRFLLFVSILFPSFIILGNNNKITPLYTVDNQISLRGNWKFKYLPSISVGIDSLFYTRNFDVTDWADIKVPGHWELQGFSEPKYKNVDEGTGLYRTTFKLPPNFKNQQVFIRFEGVLFSYDVYVNGNHVGNWASSFNAASFNITDAINTTGENTLAVRVTTRYKGFQFDISDCWALSGIFRDVVIFSIPDTYIDDYTIHTDIEDTHSAQIIVKVGLENTAKEGFEGYSINTTLYSPNGQKIAETVSDKIISANKVRIDIENPELWTAETPNLYKLNIFLIKDGDVIQKVNQNVGIREISIENAVLKLNKTAIKLRGVDHHDMAPEAGRALSEEQLIEDLSIMKEANINFIRTSHYPPDNRLLNMCDSMGFYVICEIPFNFGSSLLRDTTYKDVLLKRAEATLLRNKNHPSIIIWSIGNENPITPITLITGNLVKQIDISRPICYPQMGSYFSENYKIIPDNVDIYAPHYKSADWVEDFANTTDRPVILTEYAHALGLSFGNMADVWKEMFRNEKFAGGAVWHFQDQGILRKSEEPVDTNKITYNVWIDSLNYYKTTLDGADGIVYADRTPQVDYWQVRKAYSPVQIIESDISVHPGNQKIKLTVYNQFDFTNLNALTGNWRLYKNCKVYQEGKISINCNPHDTVTYSLPLALPENPENDVWFLQFDFNDKNESAVYEHAVNLILPERYDRLKEEIIKELNEKKWKVENKADETKIKTENFIYKIEKQTLAINLITIRGEFPLFSSGILARTGRTPKMADITVRDKRDPENGDYFWYPFLLKPHDVENITEKKENNEYSFSAKGIFFRGEKFPGQKIEGEIQYIVTNSGEITISYNLKPVNATGAFLEAGVSFILPPTIENFIWLGDGPYASYPDKHILNDFGIHYINKEDINFNGNRSNVEVAVLTDDKGNGVVILGEKENISVEQVNNRIVLGHNAYISGLGNKKTTPTQTVWAQDVNEIKGEFKIVPIKEGHWPKKLKDLFDIPIDSIKPYCPFYYSYDTSK